MFVIPYQEAGLLVHFLSKGPLGCIAACFQGKITSSVTSMGFPGGSMVRIPLQCKRHRRPMCVWALSQEDPLEKEMATHSSVPARKTAWTEEPGGLQSMGMQRVRHDWSSWVWQGTMTSIGQNNKIKEHRNLSPWMFRKSEEWLWRKPIWRLLFHEKFSHESWSTDADFLHFWKNEIMSYKYNDEHYLFL